MRKLENLKTSLTRRQRVLILVLAAVVLFGLLAATVFRDNTASVFRRISSTYSQEDFAHNAQANSLFLGMDDNLLICTQSQIQVFSPSGTLQMKESVSMTSPALNAAGDYAVVYDVGGQQLKVVAKDHLENELTLPSEESLLCATVNDKGWVAVTSKVSGYKAFYGFLSGICAGDHDITDILIDATLRIGGRDYEALADFLKKVDELAKITDTHFTFTISTDLENLPERMFEYCKKIN